MKKILVTLVLCVVALAAKAQANEMSASAQFILGAGQGITNPGLGVKLSYGITDPWRVAASFDYGFKTGANTRSWDLNFDAHYQFYFGRGFRVYPLVGLAIVNYKWKMDKSVYNALKLEAAMEGEDIGKRPSDKTTCVGVNLGAGFQYDINDQWAVYSEVKGQILSKDGSRFVWAVGGSYKF
ncbi:MAG: porin family protein [Bacteroidales bacterium]|nr:porin family protein [Bacteroidales bacterium]